MLEPLVELWKTLLQPWLTPLWDSLAFWRILAIVLGTAVVAGCSCRKTLARWVLGRKDDLSHDRAVFRKFDEMVSESLVDDALNHQYAYRWINDDALSNLSEVGRFLARTENLFLSGRVQRAAVALVTALETLLDFSGQHFYDLRGPGPGTRYGLYPDFKQSDQEQERARYERAAQELDLLIKCAWD